MNPDLALLERILWSEVARASEAPSADFDERSATVRALRAALGAEHLHPDEAEILERWDARRETGRVLLDRLLQARVNHAVRAGRAAEAERLGKSALGPPPRVVVVRADGAPHAAPARPHATLVEVLEATGSLDEADLAPGARLDELMGLLVLANQGAAEELASSLPSASVQRADGSDVVELLGLRSASVRILDVERALAALEECLRACIPPERRPAPAGEGGFARDLTGELLGGKYRVKALKGRGAFKTVYEGEDEMLGARVAIAVLNPRGARSERSLAHFQDEARLLTTLDHENIVRWITFDRAPNGLHYFVMEYLDGEELEQVLRREGRLAPARVGAILLQVLAALKRAHAPGSRGALLHLDLKPENVFLLPPRLRGEPERVKVIDFGIGQHVGADARAAERADALLAPAGNAPFERESDAPERANEAGPAGAARRVPRARGGTLLYASPEQCRHLSGERAIEALDGRSDLYSLGVMAFRMLTGEFPFADCKSAHQAIRNHLEVEPRRVGALGVAVPRPLAAFVERCLEKDRARRFQDATEAHAALERIVHPRRSPFVVALPVLALAALAVGWIYATRATPVNALTVIDPDVTDVNARAVSALDFGPRAAQRTLEVETDFAWDGRATPPEPRLVDAGGGGTVAGWSVRWSDAAARRLELRAGPGAESRAVVLELAGRGRTWRTPRLTLAYLGTWRIASAGVEGHDGERRLDPRGRSLSVHVEGDTEGCMALESVALLDDRGELLGRQSARASVQDGHVSYAGPPLDALFTGVARTLELRVCARDRAGQMEERITTLAVAGPPAGFASGTGFVASSEPQSPLLPGDGATQVLLRGNALRIQPTAQARVRVFLEPEEAPRIVRDVAADGAGLLLTLAELGLEREDEHRGTLRLELTDEPWVERAPPSVDIRRLAFLFTPRPPPLEVVLQAGARERELYEASTGAVASVNVEPEAFLLVRPPPGTDLWLEGAVGPADGAPAVAARLERHGGPFVLPLALAEEGRRRIVLRAHVLLAGDEKGPWIPPEHVYVLEVDRTEPRVELEFEGGGVQGVEPAFLGPDRLFTGELPDGLRARVTERGATAQRWILERPGADPESGTLDGAGEHDLWPRVQAALGPTPADGRYALTLEATDEAGNRGQATLGWQIARQGPVVDLVEPQATGAERRWVLGTGKSWNVRVRAEDVNGVATVSVDVVYHGRTTATLPLVASGGDLWEVQASARPSVPSWWSGQELALEVRARDLADQSTSVSWNGTVPEIPRESRLVIAPRDDRSAALVEVSAGVDYTFGGRSGEGRAGHAWNVRIPGERFPGYFLDAREVSRAEFLAFVLSEDGYASPGSWPDAGPIDEARRSRWRLELADEPLRPVTGVTWSEASAYARWRGKRLPTLVEWEFAVRGPEYRESPASEPLAALGTLGTLGTPEWPTNLCAGAREWTSTPARLGEGDFATQGRRNLALLLHADGAPGAASAVVGGSHWIVGTASAERAAWASRSIQPDGSAAGDLGFRCALDLDAVQVLLENGVYEELR